MNNTINVGDITLLKSFDDNESYFLGRVSSIVKDFIHIKWEDENKEIDYPLDYFSMFDKGIFIIK